MIDAFLPLAKLTKCSFIIRPIKINSMKSVMSALSYTKYYLLMNKNKHKEVICRL